MKVREFIDLLTRRTRPDDDVHVEGVTRDSYTNTVSFKDRDPRPKLRNWDATEPATTWSAFRK